MNSGGGSCGRLVQGVALVELFEVGLVLGDAAVPPVDSVIPYNPDFLGHLGDESEVVRNQH
jgi:hypothetical protein